jgi:sigma-B regulation protein RsbU (phosphoserine phosphatase)
MSSSNGAAKVLIADDQPDVLAALRLLLKGEGFEIRAVNSPSAILASVQQERFDLLLMDLNYTRDTTSGEEGLDLLNQLRQMETGPAVIVMTAWGSIELAVEAMRRGAADFVLKPWENTKLLATLRRHSEATAERKRGSSPQTDLAIARRVQQKLLPQAVSVLPTIEYSARCVQAGAVGGDYYDFLDLEDGRTLFVLADVSGKGVPAALLMANLQATLRSRFLSPQEKTLPALMSDVNLLFYQSTEPEHFATVFLALYDDRTRLLRYVNCGHTPPVLLRRFGGVERLDPTATVLGAFADFACSEASTTIGEGDLLAAFSDGVLEARSVEQEQFGPSRLVDVLRATGAAPLEEVPSQVFDAVANFSAYGQEDDLTMLVARGR